MSGVIARDGGPASLPVVVGVGDDLQRMPVLDRAAAEARAGRRAVGVVHVRASPHPIRDGGAGVPAQVYLRRTAPDGTIVRRCEVGDPAEVVLGAAQAAGSAP